MWMLLVCMCSGCLAAYVLFLIIKDEDLNQPEYISFILVGIIMISLSLWSGAVLMRRCHTLGSGHNTEIAPMPVQGSQAEESV